jgi:hypothetical protein
MKALRAPFQSLSFDAYMKWFLEVPTKFNARDLHESHDTPCNTVSAILPCKNTHRDKNTVVRDSRESPQPKQAIHHNGTM